MIRCKFVYAVLSGALLLQSTDALSQTQRTMTVSELFSLVETGSKQLRAQKSEVDVAHHAISEAKSRRLPDVNASLSVSYNGNVLMTDRDFSNAKGITHDNASLEDPANPGCYREMPVLGDLYEILKAAPETIRMAHILNRLVNGSASTFNKQTNVRLDNKYTVLDISSLTGDLLTVGMFVVLDFVWDRAKADRTEEKAIFIDECWQLLSGAGATGTRLAGDFVLEIFKTIRGYGGSAVCASQDLNDFFNLDEGRFGKGIINNSKTKIILNLEDDEAERVQETLHLSDAETMEVTHFERGNGLISTNNNNIMVEFKASPLEKDLITTDRRELREILERKRREQESA